MSDKIRVTVDGEPVTREVNWEQVRAYLTAKGWAQGKNAHGNEMWTCSESMPCQLFPKSWSIPVALNRIAIHKQRHLAAVLRDIARGIEMEQPLTSERDRLRAVVDALPKCLGEWVSGSGGHTVYSHDCNEPPTTWDPESSVDNDYQCDRHLAMVHPVHHKFRQDLPYAPALRALKAAATKP